MNCGTFTTISGLNRLSRCPCYTLRWHTQPGLFYCWGSNENKTSKSSTLRTEKQKQENTSPSLLQWDWETGTSYSSDVTPLNHTVPLAGRLPRIPAPARACLRRSDRIPARLRAVDEDARAHWTGVCQPPGCGRRNSQGWGGEKGAAAGRRKRCVQWKVQNLVRGNFFHRQDRQTDRALRATPLITGWNRCVAMATTPTHLVKWKFSTASPQSFKNGRHSVPTNY